jgi:hypothetical protein
MVMWSATEERVTETRRPDTRPLGDATERVTAWAEAQEQLAAADYY